MNAPFPQIEDNREEGAPPPPPARRLWMIGGALAAAAVVSLLGGTGWMLLSGSRGGPIGDDAASVTRAMPETLGGYVELPEIVANLSTGAQPRFVKLKVTLKVNGAPGPIAAQTLELRDAFHSYLNALNPDELFGASGFERLRAGLWRRAQLALGDNASALEDVLIVEFVRQ